MSLGFSLLCKKLNSPLRFVSTRKGTCIVYIGKYIFCLKFSGMAFLYLGSGVRFVCQCVMLNVMFY